MNWVKEGEANSKFFHNMMSNRQRRNSLHMVHANGVLVEEGSEYSYGCLQSLC